MIFIIGCNRKLTIYPQVIIDRNIFIIYDKYILFLYKWQYKQITCTGNPEETGKGINLVDCDITLKSAEMIGDTTWLNFKYMYNNKNIYCARTEDQLIHAIGFINGSDSLRFLKLGYYFIDLKSNGSNLQLQRMAYDTVGNAELIETSKSNKNISKTLKALIRENL